MKKTKFLRKRTLTVLLILKVLLVSGYPSSSADTDQSEGENKENSFPNKLWSVT